MVTPSNFFFFTDTSTSDIYTLSLHDALPIWLLENTAALKGKMKERVIENTEQAILSKKLATIIIDAPVDFNPTKLQKDPMRSEEHTSELQSRPHLVCRLLLEKKKNKNTNNNI